MNEKPEMLMWRNEHSDEWYWICRKHQEGTHQFALDKLDQYCLSKSAKLSKYLPPANEVWGNVLFSHVFTCSQGGLCQWGSLSRGVSVQEVCLGVSVWVCLCPGGLCPERSLSRGSLSGVSLTETPLNRDPPQTETSLKSGRYAFYWNAFFWNVARSSSNLIRSVTLILYVYVITVKCPGKDFNYCKNGGTLDPNRCTCHCDSTWVGQRCEKYGKYKNHIWLKNSHKWL